MFRTWCSLHFSSHSLFVSLLPPSISHITKTTFITFISAIFFTFFTFHFPNPAALLAVPCSSSFTSVLLACNCLIILLAFCLSLCSKHSCLFPFLLTSRSQSAFCSVPFYVTFFLMFPLISFVHVFLF